MPAAQPPNLNLTTITKYGRQSVKFVIAGIIVMIVGRFALTTLMSTWRALNPPPPPAPTVGFGLLPPIEFSEQTEADKPRQYKLETATGGLPNFGNRARVLFMPQPAVSLLDTDEASQIATGLGFVFEPEILTTRTYRWRKLGDIPSTLDLDIRDNTFVLRSDYLSRPDLLVSSQVPDVSDAITQVKTTVQRVGLLGSDIATSSGETTFLRLDGVELTEAISLSETELLRVDLFRTPIDGITSVTEEGRAGTIVGIVGGSGLGLLELRHNHRTADYSQIETYPLRPTQEAWRVLQSGEGFVAQGAGPDTAVIRTVSLAYFESTLPQEYLQPVYVFEGDNGFIGYVSALDQRYIAAKE